MPTLEESTSLVLASASPRRRDLLSQLGLRFTVAAADIDETPFPGEAADVYVLRLAREKAQAPWPSASRAPGCWRPTPPWPWAPSCSGSPPDPAEAPARCSPGSPAAPMPSTRVWHSRAAPHGVHGGAHRRHLPDTVRRGDRLVREHRRALGQGGRLRHAGQGRLPRRAASRAAPPTSSACPRGKPWSCSCARAFPLPGGLHERSRRAAGPDSRPGGGGVRACGAPGGVGDAGGRVQAQARGADPRGVRGGPARLRGELRAGAAGQGRGAGGPAKACAGTPLARCRRTR